MSSDPVQVPRPTIAFRRAERPDLERIVQLLADDPLGAKRERYELPLPPEYPAAFDAIDRDANQELVVACREHDVVGVLQVTFIPYLTYRGGWRALIEGVRVDARLRSAGVGRAMIDHAIGRARVRGCRLVQLTTDRARPDARRFYEALGFRASHDGMKLDLDAPIASGPQESAGLDHGNDART